MPATTASPFRFASAAVAITARTPAGSTATGFSVNEDGRWGLDDDAWIEPRVFLLLDAGGAEVAVYGGRIRTSALDDYFYVERIHFVDSGDLVRTMLEYGGRGWKSRLCGREIVLSGLVREDVPE